MRSQKKSEKNILKNFKRS